ncbi:MAG TPA: alpha/beta fold hydrolase [Candidatus Saccharimonadales bacterium]|nr:alpha/beta fold hydrolase [Candidatus Saccharimonadales bacterium]
MKSFIKGIVLDIRRRPALFYILASLLVTVLLGAGWLYYSHSFKKELPQKGFLAEDQLFPGSPGSAYKNLDLRIVARANYEGGQIKKIKDLGIINNVAESVISFHVAADNLDEYALMTQPTTPRPPQGYPVIILCHGYATPRIYSTTTYYLADMVEYSKSGFVVIKPDFRGQGLSLHIGSPEGAYYSMAYNTDLMSLLSSVRKTGFIDKSNISLWGHSMGAYIALRAAVLSPDIKNLILLSGPVGNIQDMYRSYIPISDRNNPIANNIKQAVLLRYGSPLSDPKFWNATSPLSYLNQLKANVQIYVGSDDRVVPPRFSADLNRALNLIHKQHQYFVYPSGAHGLLDERDQIYANSLKLLKPKTSASG